MDREDEKSRSTDAGRGAWKHPLDLDKQLLDIGLNLEGKSQGKTGVYDLCSATVVTPLIKIDKFPRSFSLTFSRIL